MAIVNKEIRGNFNPEAANDELINYNKGYTKMVGLTGDDTYVIENFSKSYTEIDDSEIKDWDDSYGNDIVQINNVKASDLSLFFDYSLAKPSDSEDSQPADELYIVKKSAISSTINQNLKFQQVLWSIGEANPDYSEAKIEEEALKKAAPQSNGIVISSHFGNTNNGGSEMGASAIENLQVLDTKTGIIRTIDMERTMKSVQAQLENVLTKIGEAGLKNYNGEQIKSVFQLLNSKHTKYKNQVINIFKKQTVYMTVVGTQNDDKLTGEVGTNIFEFRNGDGHDTIVSSKGTNDTIRFVDVDTENIRFTNKKNDLVIWYNNGENSVTIKNYLANPQKSPIKNLEFVEVLEENDTKITGAGELLDYVTVEIQAANDFRNNSIKGTNLNDEIYGGFFNDTIKAGKGDDHIYGDNGNDKLYGEGGDDTYYFALYDNGSGDGNDIIYSDKKSGEDKIIINNTNNDSVNILEKLKLTVNKNDLIIKYTDNDSITLANYFTKGTAIKTIIEDITLDGSFDDNENNPSITLDELIAKNPIEINGVMGKKNNLKGSKLNDIISGQELNDTISGGAGDDKLYGYGGNDIIKGGDGNDIIDGGSGSDKLYGEGGNNIFVFDSDSGDDTIYSGKGNDTIQFINVDTGNMTFERVGNNLIIKYNNNKLTLNNYLKNPDKHSVKNVIFDTQEPQDLKKMVSFAFNAANLDKKTSITGTLLNDTINGGNNNDILKSVGGNDVIAGGKGNDKLYAGSGNTLFRFNDGDGQDTIYMGKGEDRISINSQSEQGSSSSWKDPIYSRSGNNLVITYGSVTEDAKGREIENTITIVNYFKSANPSVKKVMLYDDNGKLLSTQDLSNVIIEGIYDPKEKVTTYTGNKEDNLIYTNGKYDFISADDGNDNIQINSKVAQVNGGDGDDIYNVNSLKSVVEIKDSSGFDKLVINEKLSNVNVLLEVNKDGSFSDTSQLSSMLIVNDATLNKITATRNLYDLSAGIEVLNAVENNGAEFAIDTIRTKDAWVDVSALKETIATWLSANGYECTSELLAADNCKSEVNSLIAYCNENAWVPYN